MTESAKSFLSQKNLRLVRSSLIYQIDNPAAVPYINDAIKVAAPWFAERYANKELSELNNLFFSKTMKHVEDTLSRQRNLATDVARRVDVPRFSSVPCGDCGKGYNARFKVGSSTDKDAMYSWKYPTSGVKSTRDDEYVGKKDQFTHANYISHTEDEADPDGYMEGAEDVGYATFYGNEVCNEKRTNVVGHEYDNRDGVKADYSRRYYRKGHGGIPNAPLTLQVGLHNRYADYDKPDGLVDELEAGTETEGVGYGKYNMDVYKAAARANVNPSNYERSLVAPTTSKAAKRAPAVPYDNNESKVYINAGKSCQKPKGVNEYGYEMDAGKDLDSINGHPIDEVQDWLLDQDLSSDAYRVNLAI